MPTEEKIWVQVETTKNTQYISSYSGLMLVRDFNDWVNGTLKRRCIKLQQVHWVEEEIMQENTLNETVEKVPVYRILGKDAGQYANFTGDIYLIAEHITAIYTLTSGFSKN